MTMNDRAAARPAGTRRRCDGATLLAAKLVGNRVAWCVNHFRHHCAVHARRCAARICLLFTAYMLVDGVLTIIAGVRAAQRHERWDADFSKAFSTLSPAASLSSGRN